MTAITTSAIGWVIAVPMLCLAVVVLIGVDSDDNRRPRP